MPEGVVIMDEMDRIEWCNPVAEKHLGINSTLDAGQHITHLVRQTQFAEYLAAPQLYRTAGDQAIPATGIDAFAAVRALWR